MKNDRSKYTNSENFIANYFQNYEKYGLTY